MFTGIIAATGKIKQIRPIENNVHNGLCLSISTDSLDLSDVKVGDSIAVNGVCLTVTTLTGNHFTVDVSQETLNCTHGLQQAGTQVNLEKAMRLSDRLGGHLVSGHVDAIGTVVKFEPIAECFELTIQAPQSIVRYLAHKGSIAVNGVSLTINAIEGNEFSICIRNKAPCQVLISKSAISSVALSDLTVPCCCALASPDCNKSR